MSDYVLTPLARADIFDIWSYIVYRPEKTPIQIVAVLHGKRDIRRLLNMRL
jgi:plasmid stabilization system protein ParE